MTSTTTTTTMSSLHTISSVSLPSSLPSSRAATPGLLEAMHAHVAANQQQQAAPQLPPYSGPTMEQLRNVHSHDADLIMARIRELVPALGAAPSATSHLATQQQQALQHQQALHAEIASLEARMAAMRASLHPQVAPAPAQLPYGPPPPYTAPSAPYAAPPHHYAAAPPPLFPSAEEYLKLQHHQPAASPAEELLQQLGKLLQPAPAPHHLHQPAPAAARRGSSKSTRASEWAKLCKAPHATKSSPDQLNMNLWCYGFVKHLLATKTGTLPQLPPEEEVARMRHFLDVLETAALHSTATDFQCQGWTIARDFDSRVMADLDQGEVTWPTISTAACVIRNYQQAVHCCQVRPPPRREEGASQPICASYNTTAATTEGSNCRFESLNPGRTCRYRHACSRCATTGINAPHKEMDCPVTPTPVFQET